MVNEQYYTKVEWNDVSDFLMKVSERYKNEFVTGIYGVPRGGAILAYLLSYKLPFQVLAAPYENCIIIDDIADSGETLLHYAKNSSGGGAGKGYHIVTMFYKKGSLVTPEFYLYEKEDKWIVYPWEQ